MIDRCILITYLVLTTITAIVLLIPRKKTIATPRDDPKASTTAFRGLGVRIIQFLAIVYILPAIVILRLFDKISSDAVMTLLGAIIGFVLSNIKEFSNRKDEAASKQD